MRKLAVRGSRHVLKPGLRRSLAQHRRLVLKLGQRLRRALNRVQRRNRGLRLRHVLKHGLRRSPGLRLRLVLSHGQRLSRIQPRGRNRIRLPNRSTKKSPKDAAARNRSGWEEWQPALTARAALFAGRI